MSSESIRTSAAMVPARWWSPLLGFLLLSVEFTFFLAACSREPSSERVHPSSAKPVDTQRSTTASAVGTDSARWEYVTFAPPDNVYDETLNRLGSEGWELVTARRARTSYGAMAYEVTLRRQVQVGRAGTTAEEQTKIALQESLQK